MCRPLTARPCAHLPLVGHCVVSLRPVGGHAALRQVAARYGAKLLALSPWRLHPRTDPATQSALKTALQAQVVVVTSPAAVDAARHLYALCLQPGQVWVAVGAGTAQRLRRAGVTQVTTPQQMDSEGLLALPVLQVLDGTQVGLITAPGGRGLIAPTLAQRGACLTRADVYERIAVTPAPSVIARLAGPGPRWLALSSQAALSGVLERLPQAALPHLHCAQVVAASERLAQHARALGFHVPAIASDARPASLLRAIVAALASTG